MRRSRQIPRRAFANETLVSTLFTDSPPKAFRPRSPNRTVAFAISALAISFLQACSEEAFSAKPTSRPNVVYIMADELGYLNCRAWAIPTFRRLALTR